MKLLKLLPILSYLLAIHSAVGAEPLSGQAAADLFMDEMALVLDIHFSGDTAPLADETRFGGLVHDEQSGSLTFTSLAFLEATGKKLTCFVDQDLVQIHVERVWEDFPDRIVEALENSGVILYGDRDFDAFRNIVFRSPELEYADSYYSIGLVVLKGSETPGMHLVYQKQDRTRVIQKIYDPTAAWYLDTLPDGSAYWAGASMSVLSESVPDIIGEQHLEIRPEGDDVVMVLTSELYPKFPAIDPDKKALGLIKKLLAVRIDDAELSIEPSEAALKPNGGGDTLAFPLSTEVLEQMAEGGHIQFDLLTLLDEHVQLIFPLKNAWKIGRSAQELTRMAAASTLIARTACQDYAGALNDIAAGVDINKALPPPDGRTALHIATLLRDSEMIRLLGDRPDLDTGARDAKGTTCLHLAAGQKDAPEILEALLSIGCDPDIRDPQGRTPLMRTLGHLEQMVLLMDAGADVNAADPEGYTPLHHMAGDADSLPAQIDLLIRRGADPNRRSSGGATPLMAAVENLCRDQIDALLAAEVDLDIRNSEGLTALEIARSYADLDPGEEKTLEKSMMLDLNDPADVPIQYERLVRKLENSSR